MNVNEKYLLGGKVSYEDQIIYLMLHPNLLRTHWHLGYGIFGNFPNSLCPVHIKQLALAGHARHWLDDNLVTDPLIFSDVEEFVPRFKAMSMQDREQVLDRFAYYQRRARLCD